MKDLYILRHYKKDFQDMKPRVKSMSYDNISHQNNMSFQTKFSKRRSKPFKLPKVEFSKVSMIGLKHNFLVKLCSSNVIVMTMKGKTYSHGERRTTSVKPPSD